MTSEDATVYKDNNFTLIGYWMDHPQADGSVDRVYVCDGSLKDCVTVNGKRDGLVHGVKIAAHIVQEQGAESLFNLMKKRIRDVLENEAKKIMANQP